ncbi:hypothetical protein, partial [Rhodobacter ferrooxidans]|uniref:hypothetical protein n=1 Tax=Rhodobacter ferrooxidans TaxID=371731 RepID=UPI001E3C8E2B
FSNPAGIGCICGAVPDECWSAIAVLPPKNSMRHLRRPILPRLAAWAGLSQGGLNTPVKCLLSLFVHYIFLLIYLPFGLSIGK